MSMKVEIRDLRDKFFRTDDEYLNGYARICGIYATGVYMSLCRHADKEDHCFPGIDLISEELAVSRPSVIKGIKKLEELNIIQVARTKRKNGRQMVNGYWLVNKRHWKDRVNDVYSAGRVNVSTSAESTTVQNRVNDVDCKETQRQPNTKRTIPSSPKVMEYASDFLGFWEKYPRKFGKGAAWKAWQKAKLPPIPELMEILESHTRSPQWLRDNGQFIPYPSTWLNGRRWEDEVEEPLQVKRYG